jgi:hypothetical protein
MIVGACPFLLKWGSFSSGLLRIACWPMTKSGNTMANLMGFVCCVPNLKLWPIFFFQLPFSPIYVRRVEI